MLPLVEFTYNNSYHSSIGMAPTTGIGRAIKSRKLTPRFVRPYQILRRIGAAAYEIALPSHLANLHNVFHVSQLRKYIADPSHILESNDIQIREDLMMNTGPVRILDSQVKKLRGKEIKTVKVLWDETTQEMTWEMEDRMRQSYLHLFPGKFYFRGRKS